MMKPAMKLVLNCPFDNCYVEYWVFGHLLAPLLFDIQILEALDIAPFSLTREEMLLIEGPKKTGFNLYPSKQIGSNRGIPKKSYSIGFNNSPFNYIINTMSSGMCFVRNKLILMFMRGIW